MKDKIGELCYKQQKLQRYTYYISCVLAIFTLINVTGSQVLNEIHSNQYREESSEPPRQKLAFLFMIYDKHDLPSYWNQFFKNAPAEKFTILYHVKNEKKDIFTSQMKVPGIRKVPTIPSNWGDMSQVRVAIQLLRYGLEDQQAEKFIFISQSCLPLYDFDTMYEKLMSHEYSMFEFTDLEQSHGGRFSRFEYLLNHHSKDTIFKHSSWSLLKRSHAELLVREEEEIIKDFSTNCPYANCETSIYSPDEGLIGSALAFKGLLHEVMNGLVIHTNWYYGYIQHYSNFTLHDLQIARLRGAVVARKVKEDCEIQKKVREVIFNEISLGQALTSRYYVRPSQFSLKEQSYKSTFDVKTIMPPMIGQNGLPFYNNYYRGRLAILFVVNEYHHAEKVWTRFFKDIPNNFYQVYVIKTKITHGGKDFNFDDAPYQIPIKVIEFNQQLPFNVKSKPNFKTLSAQIQVVQAALQDNENKKFLLLSESCMPVFDFPTIYKTIMSSDSSFIDVSMINEKAQGKHKRYEQLMKVFNVDEIISHPSQIVLNRDHAEAIVQIQDQIAGFWGNFCDIENPETVVIATTLSNLGLLSGVENMCISFYDMHQQENYRKLLQVKREHVIDAKQRCLFLTKVQFLASVHNDAFNHIFGVEYDQTEVTFSSEVKYNNVENIFQKDNEQGEL
eukprot:403368611